MAEDIGVLRGRIQIDIDATIANLRKLHRAMRVASAEIGKSTSKVVAASRALDKHAVTTQRVTKSKKAATRQTALWQMQMQNLTKSVQLALGPLSGVAARITALTALFNRNTIVLAGVIGGLTGVTVASAKAIAAGRAFEQQMMKIDGILTVLGPNAQFTSAEINDMAVALGEATLASAGGMRDAAAALLQFRNISRDSFKPILEAAQGLTVTIGGNLIRNVRRLGRAFEDPAENLESLERSGISFTESQKDMIEVMLNTGEVAEANAIVLSEMETQIAAATSEAGGLSGAMDTLGEQVTRFFEEAAIGSGLIGNLTQAVREASTQMQNLLDNGTSAKAFGDVLAAAVNGAVGAFRLLIENIQAVAITLTAVFAGAVAKTVTSGIVALTMSVGGLITQVRTLGTVATGTAKAVTLLQVVTKAVPLLAAAGAIWATVTALSQYTEGTDEAAQETRDLASRLSSATLQFDNMGTAARKAASARLVEIADQIDAIDARKKAIEEEERVLEKSFLRNPQGRQAPAFQSGMAELAKEEKELTEQRAKLVEQTERYTEAGEKATKLEKNLGNAPKFFKEMRAEFQPHVADMAEYRVRLESAQKIMDKFQSSVADGGFSEAALEEMEKIGMTAETFREILESIENSKPVPKGLDKAQDTFQSLTEDVTKYSRQLMNVDYDAQAAEAQKLTKHLEDHPEAAKAHALELGILNAQMMGHGETVDAIVQKYLALIKNRDHLKQQDVFTDMEADLRRQLEAVQAGDDAILRYTIRSKLASEQGKEFAKVSDEQVEALFRLEKGLTQTESNKAFEELTADLWRQAEALREGEEAFKRYEAQAEIAATREIKFGEVLKEEVDELREAQEAVENATRTQAFKDMSKDLDRQMEAAKGGNDALQRYNDLTEIASTLGVKFSEVTQDEADALIEKFEALRKIEQQNAFDDLTDDLNRQILAISQGEDAFERYTARMALASKQGIEFSEVNEGQLEIFLQQRKAMERVQEQAERMTEAYNGAGRAIGSTLDEVLGESVRLGQSLSDTFKDATDEALNFGNILEFVGRKLADVILQTQVIDPLEQGVADLVRNMFAPSGGSGFVDDGTRAPVTTGHTGGIVGNLKKYHSGGIVGGGLKSDEELSVLQKGEGVFTRDQMAAMGGGGVEIIFIDQRTNSDPAPQVEEGTGPNGKRQIKIWLKDAIREASGDGTMDDGLGSRYGMRPQTARRRQ